MTRKQEKDLTLLEKFVGLYRGWDGYETDPWDRDNGFQLKRTLRVPNEGGVYMFESEESGPYYIGKSDENLNGRLARKLSSDIKEKRVENYRDELGRLHHKYLYLPTYDDEISTIHYMKTRGQLNASEAERILIAAYLRVHGETPIGNRMKSTSFATIPGEHADNLLREIAMSFGL